MSGKFPSHDSDFDLEPELQSAVSAVLSEPIDIDAVERVKAKAKTLSPHCEPRQAAPGSRSSRRTWLSMALAASLLMAIGVAILFPTAPSAFGQVLKQLREAGAFRYMTLIYLDNAEQPIESTILVAQDRRQRRETLQSVTILDASGAPRLTLLEDAKVAIIPAASKRKANPQDSGTILDWFDKLRNHGDEPDRRLERKELADRTVEGFVAQVQDHEYVLWIDVETNDLIQVEFGPLVEGTNIRRIVMNDFRFNQDFDNSLFSLEVPAGYKIQKLKPVQAAIGGETSIIAALRGYLNKSQGMFPESLTSWGEWAILFSRDGQLSEEDTAVMGHLGVITPFLVTKSKADYEYLGKGKTTDDPPSIVFWYRNDDGIIRAINSDLTVTEIEESELP